MLIAGVNIAGLKRMPYPKNPVYKELPKTMEKNSSNIFTALLILTVLMISSCGENNLTNPVIVKPDKTDITGHVFSGGIPVEEAVLTLDTLTTVTDSTSFYVFSNVTGDSFTIKVRHPEFSDFECCIPKSNPTVWDIELTRTHYDYFPLKIGNKWRFSFTSSGYAGSPTSGYSSWSSKGKIYWEITAKKKVGKDNIFSVMEKYSDSTGTVIQDTTFSLVLDSQNKIGYNGWSRILKGGLPFNRYELISANETKMYFHTSGGSGDYTLKRKTGLTRASLSYGGITMGYSYLTELEEFTGY